MVSSAWGAGGDHDALDAAGDRLEVVVRRVSLHLVGMGVDRGDAVAALPQPLVDDVGAVILR
jgi:hypothetical protein